MLKLFWDKAPVSPAVAYKFQKGLFVQRPPDDRGKLTKLDRRLLSVRVKARMGSAEVSGEGHGLHVTGHGRNLGTRAPHSSLQQVENKAPL